MKGFFSGYWLSLGISAIAAFHSGSVQAVTFGQQEVNQADFVAIARPYGNRQYDLLILQQLPGKRPCWQEQAGTPTLINPLLLNFDFTGSCERSTDSNGYSIRLNGQDMGLTYLLRVIERNGELILVATNRSNPTQPEVLVGRTQGLSPGFMKIQLDPGWRFTKRTYAGKILSHIYLTGDGNEISGDRRPNPPNPTNPQTFSPPHTNVINYPAPPAIQQPPLKEFIFTAPNNIPAPNNPSIRPQSNNLKPSPNSPAIATLPGNRPINQTVTPTWQTSPLPTSRINTNSSAPTLTASNSNLLPPPPSSPKPIPTSGWGMTPTNDATVPAATTPLFSNPPARSSLLNSTVPAATTPLFSNPPARPSLLNSTPNLSSLPTSNNQSYRVLAAVSDPVQQAQVKSIYPQAFTTSYNGQRLLQIGRFTSRENAEQASQGLQGMGLRAMIVP